MALQQRRDLRWRYTVQRQQHHHRPGSLPPPAVQVSLQLLNFTG
jgi:hypothetical protein